MGSVRRASWKQYLPFLALNVVVSAVTVLLVLSVWGGGDEIPTPMPTPTFDVAARLANAIPTETATLPPSPTPVTYTVRAGDTLGAIAAELEIPIENLMAANGLTDPDALTAGQVLIVPSLQTGLTATPEPRGVEVTVTPEGAPKVVIRGAYEQGSLEDEFVYLENLGGVAAMAGWSLDDGEGNTFVFPGFTLYNGGGVNVYTRAGTNSVINLFWGMDRPLWEPGKLITLQDATGAVVSSFAVPQN
jgi:LysM repeat protein